jgi:hypothetical protein
LLLLLLCRLPRRLVLPQQLPGTPRNSLLL